MSTEIRIQESPAVTDGAETPLSPDAARGRTKGGDFEQNSMSFCRGQEVAASSADVASRNGLNDGAQVRGVSVSVKQTSHKALEGSNASTDFRKSGDTAAASLARSADNGGPRAKVGQAQSSKYLP